MIITNQTTPNGGKKTMMYDYKTEKIVKYEQNKKNRKC